MKTSLSLLLFSNIIVQCKALYLSRSSYTTAFLTKMSPTRHRGAVLKPLINVKFPSRGGGEPGKLRMISFDSIPMTNSINIILASNLVGFIVSVAMGTQIHLDLIGTGAFALSALPSLISSNLARVKLSSLAVTLWATKLAGFLFFRAFKTHDLRLQETLNTVSGTASFWFVSALWGVLCSLPHLLGMTSSAPGNPLQIKIGIAIYSLGLITESLSDCQKWMFKQENPKAFCNVGLWSVSQHPNWFGNLLLWTGIFIINMSSLVEPRNRDEGGIPAFMWRARRVFIALLSPLFMYTLFSSQATGSLTPAVELANKKYGGDVNYKHYTENVPLIIPGLVGWLRKLLPIK